jgi:hypothetical protein
MQGWKTIVAGVISIAYGLVEIIINGNVQSGFQFIMAGLAILGIGHKLDKIKK